MSYACKLCGRHHEGVSLDFAYSLPDHVWALPAAERAARGQASNDLCRLDGRFFIRAFLAIPLLARDEVYGWGVWVEVAATVFERYLVPYDQDGRGEPTHPGKLANAVPTYPESLGLPVLVQFGSETQRPAVTFPSEARHQFAREQRSGIDETRLHGILVATGALPGPDPA